MSFLTKVARGIAMVLLVPVGVVHARPTPIDSTITYQGLLKQNGQGITGQTDMIFQLFDAPVGGNAVCCTKGEEMVPVTDGLFTVELEFGSAAFGPEQRWLEIMVRFPANEGNYVVLSPRQRITAAPVANFALSANGATIFNLNANNITSGNVTADRLPVGGDWALSAPLNLDSNTFVVNANNDRVGIGTASPAQKFEIHGSNSAPGTSGSAADGIARFKPATSGASLDVGVNGSPAHAWLQARDAANYSANFNLALNPNGGSVGIGTGTPHGMYRFTVKGDGAANPVSGAAFLSGANTGAFLGYPTANDILNFELWNANNGFLRFGTNNIERLRIDSNGAVGIGTVNPSQRLEVRSGNIGIDNNFVFAFRNTGNSNYVNFIRTDSQNALVFETNGTIDRMLIDASGRVGIGRTPTTNLLEVEGNASKSSSGSWLANSDGRIKTAVRDLDNALDVISRVRPVAFRYTDRYRSEHPSIVDVEYYNVIAQEFAEVFPDSVQDSGEKLPNGESILQVDVHPMLIHTVAAVQQLHQIILEKDVNINHLEAANIAQARMIDELLRRVEALEQNARKN